MKRELTVHVKKENVLEKGKKVPQIAAMPNRVTQVIRRLLGRI